MEMRLHKFMAECGVASRRESEKLIEQGRVLVNGAVVAKVGASIDPEKDAVKVDGKLLKSSHSKVYLVLNKPRNVITSMKDPEGRKCVADILPRKALDRRIYPVGRLDYDVNGCLLLTNDGALADKLAHPRSEVERVYRVKVLGVPENKTISRLRKQVKRCRIKFIKRKAEASWWLLTLYEGKYHQVKKMWQNVGHPVSRLSRVSFAGIDIEGVPSGKLRNLTPLEIKRLKSVVNKKSKIKSSTRRKKKTH